VIKIKINFNTIQDNVQPQIQTKITKIIRFVFSNPIC